MHQHFKKILLENISKSWMFSKDWAVKNTSFHEQGKDLLAK